jgi:lethal(2) giant larvae protein
VEPVNAQLAKEIQLKHRAPVVSINIIDASYAAIGESFENSGIKSTSESCPPHRVVISSEEQFKVGDEYARN